MTTKHTPGPWKVEPPLEDEIDQNTFITAHNGKTLVAEILSPMTDEEGDYRGTFDANLIAAAPEMLEACIRAAICLRPDVQPLEFEREATLSLLRAAIARAKGD